MSICVDSPRLDLRRADCMDLMKEFEDNHFDLAIVDPPYGIGIDGRGMPHKAAEVIQKNGSKLTVARNDYRGKKWDSDRPKGEYFSELERVSAHQIIWGANHFGNMRSSPCWIVWDKVNKGTDQSDCALAWTNFSTAVRKFSFMWSGMHQGSSDNGARMEGNKKLNEKRIHPTQKPVQLYKWILTNYAEPGQRILDTHMGSGSIAIACHYFGAHLTACEIDEDYFRAACERIERETRQATLWEGAMP